MSDTPAVQAVTVSAPAAAPSLVPGLVEIGAAAGALAAIFAFVALISKLITRDVVRDVAEVKHKLGNHGGRLDAVERLRSGDVERIIRVEASIAGIERTVDRVEKLIQSNFEALADSIREIRHVEPRR